MKNLISMVDFVLDLQETPSRGKGTLDSAINYANFLKQPLELCMFVPCDDDGNVLENPCKNNACCVNFCQGRCQENYYEAKERCLFEDHDLDIETIKHHIKLGRTVEYFTIFATFKLTETAIKQLGL